MLLPLATAMAYACLPHASPAGFTLHWWPDTLSAEGPREALVRSLITAVGATAVALLLGTMAAREWPTPRTREAGRGWRSRLW